MPGPSLPILTLKLLGLIRAVGIAAGSHEAQPGQCVEHVWRRIWIAARKKDKDVGRDDLKFRSRQGEAGDGDCNTWSTIREGTYGEQGDFAWARSTPARVPSASAFRPGTSCSDYWFRGVFVDWTDYEGT